MSLRAQLTLSYGLLLIATLGACCSFLYVMLAATAYQNFDAVLRARANDIARELNTGEDPYLDPGDITQDDLIPSSLDEQSEPAAYVQVLDHRGDVVATTGTHLPVGEGSVSTALGGREHVGEITLYGAPLRVLSVPVQIDKRIVGVVQVGQTTQLVEQTLDNMRRLLLSTSAVTLLVAVLVGWLLARRALAPLARITSTAQHIADTHDFSQRIGSGQQGSEVDQLARVFNVMIGRIEAAFAHQREFLADTSHELRNPLTVIRGNLGLLRQTTDAETRLLAAFEAESEAARMSRLVDNLLLLARAESGQELERVPVQLEELLAGVVARASSVVDDRQLSLVVDRGVTVLGDRDRLTQVFWNILENAIRYTPANKAIRVELRRANGQAVVEIADEGIGIAPEHLPRIFERFYRVDKTRSRSTGGSGLGLAIVDYLIRAHGGTIRVESEPGHGTRFTIRLALASITRSRQAGAPRLTPVAAAGAHRASSDAL